MSLRMKDFPSRTETTETTALSEDSSHEIEHLYPVLEFSHNLSMEDVSLGSKMQFIVENTVYEISKCGSLVLCHPQQISSERLSVDNITNNPSRNPSETHIDTAIIVVKRRTSFVVCESSECELSDQQKQTLHTKRIELLKNMQTQCPRRKSYEDVSNFYSFADECITAPEENAMVCELTKKNLKKTHKMRSKQRTIHSEYTTKDKRNLNMSVSSIMKMFRSLLFV